MWKTAASPIATVADIRIYFTRTLALAHRGRLVGEWCAMHVSGYTSKREAICPFQVPFPGSFGPHEFALKRHLNRFSRFCTFHPCDKLTDMQNTLRATCAGKRAVKGLL